MIKVRDITSLLEEIAPLHYQEHYDNSGLQVGDWEEEVRGCLVCLDVTEEIIDEAVALGCNMILSHHPIIFFGLKHLLGKTHSERVVEKAIRNNIILYASHTNLDKSPKGVNYNLGKIFGLKDMHTLSPETSLGENVGLGVIGELEEEIPIIEFLLSVKEKLCLQVLKHSKCSYEKRVKRVALCGGSGSELYKVAMALKADVYLTGEIKYPIYYEATENMIFVDIEHFESEYTICSLFVEIIKKKFPNFVVRIAQASKNPIKYLL
ncbi:MAG TPA: Nif3-like dinuclear metal center hexameric protein [Porphyromonadaceae bacterium]|nr:Nif3-like dinuclear metal center hexameric protein [Porphyromonadaceae bacterium]